MKKDFLFTSESVSEGHPDKVCDRISDMVVDTYLSSEPESRVACETLTTTNKVVMAGEVRGPEIKKDDLIQKVRDCIKDIGYDQEGFTYKEATKIECHLHSQSADIAMGVDSSGNKDEGAGDRAPYPRELTMRRWAGMLVLALGCGDAEPDALDEDTVAPLARSAGDQVALVVADRVGRDPLVGEPECALTVQVGEATASGAAGGEGACWTTDAPFDLRDGYAPLDGGTLDLRIGSSVDRITVDGSAVAGPAPPKSENPPVPLQAGGGPAALMLHIDHR